MFKSNFLLIVLLFLIISCKKDSDTKFSITSFPLKLENEWQYKRTSTIEYTDPKMSKEKSSSNFTMKVIKDTLINAQLAFKVSHKIHGKNTSQESFRFYHQQKEGLYLLGYDSLSYGTIVVFDKKPRQKYKSSAAISSFVPSSRQIQFLKYPSRIGDKWQSNEYYYKSSRKYIKNERVTTPAGVFDCICIEVIDETEYTDSATHKVYQYYSKEGLIKEEQHFDNMTVAEGGKASARFILELSSYKIK
jgi:hypothetical protein